MNSSVVRFYADRRIAYVGPDAQHKVNLANKWGGVYNRIEPLFDDGLSYSNHCMSLYLQNDSKAWREFVALCERTKQQGKTVKTVWKKEEYFRKGFWKVIHDNPQLAKIEKEESKTLPYEEQFCCDSALCSWWLQWYFDNYDAELKIKVVLYAVDEDYAQIIRNAEAMEKRMKGNNTPPELKLFAASEKKLDVDSARDCVLKFEWRRMDFGEACRLMELCKKWIYRSHDGSISDWSGTIRKKLRKMFPKCDISCMDTPYNLYQEKNNWFYIYFTWEPKDFSFAQVRKAERAVKKLICPHIKKPFLPEGEEEPYQIVTLSFK